MNKMIVIGNLTRDPELAYTPSGVAVCNFTLAVNDRRWRDGDQQNSAQFFRVTVWRQLGEACAKYLAKGRKAYVSGPLTARTYTANDGSTRVSLDITADDVEFLSGRNDAEQPSGPAQSDQTESQQASMFPSGYTAVETDDLPF